MVGIILYLLIKGRDFVVSLCGGCVFSEEYVISERVLIFNNV